MLLETNLFYLRPKANSQALTDFTFRIIMKVALYTKLQIPSIYFSGTCTPTRIVSAENLFKATIKDNLLDRW